MTDTSPVNPSDETFDAAAAAAAGVKRPARLVINRRRLVRIALAMIASLVLLYVGTNVSASMRQRSLRARWDSLLAQGPLDAAALATRSVAVGEPVARITIRSIELDLIVVSAGSGRRAPAHAPRTVIPGLPGLSAIIGNRFAFGNHFMHLEQLRGGDRISVQTRSGTHLFVVEAVVRAPQSSINLSVDSENPLLLLISPARAWGGGDERLIVRARATGKAAP